MSIRGILIPAFAILLTTLLLAGLAAYPAQARAVHAPAAARAALQATPEPASDAPADFHSSPVMFIQNMGQWDARARFQVWGGPATMWLADDGVWLTALEPQRPEDAPGLDELLEGGPTRAPVAQEPEPRRGVNLRLSFVGANPHPRIEPFDRLDTVVSYFIGADESQWHPDVPVWGGVRYVDLYPGVDLEITNVQALQSLLGVKTETVPRQKIAWRLICQDTCSPEVLSGIRLRVEGATNLSINQGQITFQTEVGEIQLPLLNVWDKKGNLNPLLETPTIREGEILTPFTSANDVFEMQNVERVIQNGLMWSTFLGGGYDDRGYSVRLDENNNAYIVGFTASGNFPTTPGAYNENFNGWWDAFAAKINVSAKQLRFVTFLGGSDGDHALGVDIDHAGNVYVIGKTYSSDFPIPGNAIDNTYNGSGDVFYARLNSEGSTLLAATYLGGSGEEWGNAIDLNGGSVYIGGSTDSTDFPTTPGAFDRSFNGGSKDTFVAKLHYLGNQLQFSTYLGGSDYDWGLGGIRVNQHGEVIAFGYTESLNFPTTSNAFDSTINGVGDLFLTKFSNDGHRVLASTFIGSDGGEFVSINSLALDVLNNIYVTLGAYGWGFPLTSNAYSDEYHGNGDVAIAKLDSELSQVLYGTYLGGSNEDFGRSVTAMADGTIAIGGVTSSVDFPITGLGQLAIQDESENTFFTKLTPNGSELDFSTVWGGSNEDEIIGIDSNESGLAVAVGYTKSPDIYITSDAIDQSFNGGDDGLIGRFDFEPPPPNDDFDRATEIQASRNAFSRSYHQDTTRATTAADDPEFTCVSGQKFHTVWYKFRPAVEGILSIDTEGSAYDTVLAVWRGSRGNLTAIECDDDGGTGTLSRLEVEVRSNTTYFIEVAGYGEGSYGTLVLNVAFQPTADTTPPSISNIRESNDPINRNGCTEPTKSTIRADVTDTGGIASVVIHYRTPGGQWLSANMRHETGNTFQAEIGPFGRAGEVRYYIEAQDSAGNENTSSTFTLTVQDCYQTRDIFSHKTDITTFLPDSSYEVWGWAEDSSYLYFIAVKRNILVDLITVDKASRNVISRSRKYATGVDGARVALKWGRVYVITYIVEQDGVCSSPVHWDFWRVNGSNWTHIYRSSHNEGGFIPYLIATNNYLFAVGDYSPCASWGTKIVRLDRGENARVWTSETFSDFYHNSVFSTGDQIYLIHTHWNSWRTYLEQYPENTNSFFASLHHVGDGVHPAFVTDGTHNVVLIGRSKRDDKAYMIINGDERLIFDRPSIMQQAWVGENGHIYAIFRERYEEQWHVVEILPSSRDFYLSPETFPGARVGTKFMLPARERNPGFVLNRSDGRKILITLLDPWEGACTPSPQPLDVALVMDKSGSMDGDPIRDAKNAAKSFLNHLNPTLDQAALITFSSSAQLVEHLTNDFGRIHNAIDGIVADGRTAIGDGIAVAHQELNSSRHRSNAKKVLILLSDGENNEGQDPQEAAQQAKQDNIRIITIGLGGNVDESLLQTIASSPSDYYFAPDSSELQAIYESIAGSICRTATPKLFLPIQWKAPNTGNIAGTVVNATNNQPISGARVCLTNTQLCTTTDSQGQYTLTNVSTGNHQITASADHFVSLTQSITVIGGRTVTLNFALSPNLAQGEIRIVLTWGRDPEDLDSHLWLPPTHSYHVFYSDKGNCQNFPYACLDVDDVTSYGPETITITRRFDGTYTYAVHHYYGNGSLSTSSAVVRVYDASGLLREFHVPSGNGIWWYVFDLDGSTGQITSRNYITPDYPGPYTFPPALPNKVLP